MTLRLQDAIAGAILVAVVATYLGMEWLGRQPDSILLVATVAIALGAGYHLWDDAMAEGTQAAQDLSAEGDDDGDD